MNRDEEAVAEFVERFADRLLEAGMPRQASRVFVQLLVTDSGRLTAAELSELLQISAGAVSGAVRYLIQVDLIARERAPGTRHDTFRVHDDSWHEALTQRDAMLLRWVENLSTGVASLGPDSPAGRRVQESVEFFRFVAAEMPAMLARWRASRTTSKE